jgi:hypothetical protein
LAGYSEWTTHVGGSSQVVKSAAASFPDRGSYGLRLTTAGDAAYVRKTVSASLPPGESFYLGFWLRINTLPVGTIEIAHVENASRWVNLLYLTSAGQLGMYAVDDALAEHPLGSGGAAIGAEVWYYLVLKATRSSSAVASDGSATLYIQGVEYGGVTGLDNYDIFPQVGLVQLGDTGWYAASGGSVDFDEVKLATDDYPQPFSPAPADELPSGARTCLLFYRTDVLSRRFAAGASAALGIPQANLIALPNCGANESITYANYVSTIANVTPPWPPTAPASWSVSTCRGYSPWPGKTTRSPPGSLTTAGPARPTWPILFTKPHNV